MLLSDVVFLVNVALQGGEDISFLHDILPASTLYVEKGYVGDTLFVGGCIAVIWGYSEIFEFFSKHDDGLLA